jgi:hypothetical protein
MFNMNSGTRISIKETTLENFIQHSKVNFESSVVLACGRVKPDVNSNEKFGSHFFPHLSSNSSGSFS